MILSMLSLTLGCLPTMSASITAVITDNNQETIENADIELRAWDGSLLEELVSNEDGSFEATLPPYQEFFVVISSEEHPRTSFTGYSGEGAYTVPNGTLWLRTFDEVQDAQASYTACADTREPETGFVEGQAKLYISGSPIDDLPNLTTATATVTQNEDQTFNGCYLPTLDENGESIESDVTGDSGQYAVFNVPEGLAELTVEIDVDGELYAYPYWVYVPADGVVPLYPTLIPFLELP